MHEQKVLAELLRLVRELNEKTPKELPAVLNLKDAAAHIGVGLTKLKSLIEAGVVVTRRDLGKEMVPSSEILRLSQAPPSKKRGHGGRTKKEVHDPDKAAAEIKAQLRAKGRKR